MAELEARKVKLVGGGIADDGRHGALVFLGPGGERFALALDVEQFADLVRMAALLQSQARKLKEDEVVPIPVERWSTTGHAAGAVLTLQVYGGLELRFDVSPGTKA